MRREREHEYNHNQLPRKILKMDNTDLGWEPPSEAEMKLIDARRERSDKISKMMSGYLLKGYKMLNATCCQCDTILLEDREGKRFCISCTELDSDVAKDDPMVNKSAAMSAAREMEMACAASSTSVTDTHTTSGTMEDGDRARLSKLGSVPSSSIHSQETENGQRPVKEGSSQVLSMSSIDVQSWTGGTEENIHTSPRSDLPKLMTESNFRDSGLSSRSYVRYEHKSLSSGTKSIDELTKKITWASGELKESKSVEYSINLCQLIKAASEAISAIHNASI